MEQVDEIIEICREILEGEQFLEDTVIYDIKQLALEIKDKINKG